MCTVSWIEVVGVGRDVVVSQLKAPPKVAAQSGKVGLAESIRSARQLAEPSSSVRNVASVGGGHGTA